MEVLPAAAGTWIHWAFVPLLAVSRGTLLFSAIEAFVRLRVGAAVEQTIHSTLSD